MRCPDCNKFVSMENGDPEVNSLEATWQGNGVINVTADLELFRNCADCGTQLKSAQPSIETDLDLAEQEAWRALPEDKRARILAALEADSAIVNVDNGDPSVDESGGGRYAKNMITVTLPITIKIEAGELDRVEFSADLSESLAASEFEECC